MQQKHSTKLVIDRVSEKSEKSSTSSLSQMQEVVGKITLLEFKKNEDGDESFLGSEAENDEILSKKNISDSETFLSTDKDLKSMVSFKD